MAPEPATISTIEPLPGDPPVDPAFEAAPSPDTEHANVGGLVIGFSFYLFIGAILVWNNETVRTFAINNRWPLAILGLIFLGGMVIAWIKQDLITASAKRQIGAIIFIVIPLLLVLVATVWLLPPAYQVKMLRVVFLLIVCLLPAVMYYLFIASRKSSLLQEYFTNLARLGLFERQALRDDGGQPRSEKEFERRVRVISYIQKFEAAYGPIPEPLTHSILDATDPDTPAPSLPDFQRHATGVGGYFSPETAIPVVLATLLLGLGWLMTLPPWETIAFFNPVNETGKLSQVLRPKPIAVHYAFLGAYFFSLQMLFRRFVRKDLRANAYLAIALRILLAVVGTWAVLQAVGVLKTFNITDGAEIPGLLVMGFVVGAFPPVAWQVIQAAFRTLTGASYFVPSLRSNMPLSDLDGLTVWHEARLEEEDIENVPNMASADIVELMLNTRMPPDRIVDWVDQSILYTQLGSAARGNSGEGNSTSSLGDCQRLRAHGIRSASALLAAYGQSGKRGDLELFETILPSEGRSRLRSLADTLGNNPNLTLVQRWRRQEDAV